MVKITLKDTLNEFLEAEFASDAKPSPPRVYIPYRAVPDPDLAINYLCNEKYAVSNWRIPKANAASLCYDHIVAPQWLSWMAGKLDCFFYEDARISDSWDKVKDDLALTLSVLNPECRLRPVFYTSPEQIGFLRGDALVIPFNLSDVLAQTLPHHIEPDRHYGLLTKRTLALSGLPTPPARVIDFDELDHSRTDHDLDAAVTRALSVVKNHALPFVLKTNNCSSGKGTFVVRSLHDREDVLKAIEANLRLDLVKINPDNINLRPFSLIITDIVPGDALSINFYVKRDGRAQISSVCDQKFSDSNVWNGAVITYSAQGRLMASYDDVVQKTAAFLRSRDYHGPAGIDVMTDESGNHLVIDVNPRPTGSFPLGCLRPHFVDKLSFDHAYLLSHLEFSATRDSFSAAFEAQLETGGIVVIAWFTDPRESHSHATLIIGGRTASALEELCEHIESWAHDQRSIAARS